ncbi:winged helix-turn-helix domain-containing protein [Enterobacteriaceae bacterium BIT-l23]|uniref:winged helix-turn-helix domain-containing protein n=1 Tax=Jejubacter sp. L23 TaxID=3092086 RepID=UPI001584D386|nr:winged helix-turn-helix domain-containing protein [Enterobacteriaceae bacterium BIT-l23]
MKYIIANRVVYDSDAALLICNDVQYHESKKLTNTANRILALLIESRGEVIERQYLLENVWESYGHVGSNGSLNQYISILRKSLASLTDLDDIIIAVPKVGFLFSPDIDVLPWKETVEVSKKRRVPLWFLDALLCALIVMVLFLNIDALFKNNLWQPYTKTVKLYQIEKCQIKSYIGIPARAMNKMTEAINRISPYLKERCTHHPALVIVQAQRNVLYGGGGRLFLSFCPLSNGNVSWCESSYYYNWAL